MVECGSRGDRISRQQITFSPERQSRRSHTPAGEHMRKERTMLSAAYGMLAMLPVAFWVGRVRDGVAITSSWPSPIVESASSTTDADTQVLRAANEEQATLIQ